MLNGLEKRTISLVFKYVYISLYYIFNNMYIYAPVAVQYCPLLTSWILLIFEVRALNLAKE